MSQEIAVQDEKRIAKFGNLMDEEQVSGSDILMPTLLLMQPLSGMVTNEKAKAGEWRGSLSENLLCLKGETVEVIPFGFHKTWVVFKKDPTKNRPEFVRVEPFAIRPTRGRAEMLEGTEYLNFETINYLVLAAKEALQPTTIPYLLRFRSTGYVVGKKMETMRAQLQKAKKPHCFSTFKLGAIFKENEKGKFFVPTLDWGRDTTDEELSVVKPWMELAKSGRVKADESDLKQDGATASESEPAGDGDFEC